MIPPGSTSRRRFLALLGATGAGATAGCGSGDDDGATTTGSDGTPSATARATSSEPAPTTSAPQPTEESTTTTGAPVDGMVDRTWRHFVPPPRPEGVVYNPYTASSLPWWFDGRESMELRLFQLSADGELIPEAVREWNYANQVLTIELHHDLAWVTDTAGERSPTNVTAADWVDGTAALDGHRLLLPTLPYEYFERSERVDEHTFRVFVGGTRPTLREFYPLLGGFVLRNAAFFAPQVEALRDASSTDAERDAIEALGERAPHDPDPFTSTPFRVAGTTSDRWQLELRDDEDQPPRWVDEINYPRAEVVVREDIGDQRRAFVDGRVPFAGSQLTTEYRTWNAGEIDLEAVDADVPFETTAVGLPRPMSPAGYAFDLETPPTSDPHFRRALAYLLDRSAACTRFMSPDEVLTGFLTAVQEERWLSADVLEGLRTAPHDNYVVDGVETERAAAELRAGGYERDSEGRWLFREGDRAGEPIVLEVQAVAGFERLVDAATAFADAATSFGVDLSVTPTEQVPFAAMGEHGIALTFWGGRYPTEAYAQVPHQSGWFDYSGTVESPPVGSYSTPPDAASDEREPLDVTRLAEVLTATEGASYAEAVDRFAWYANQQVPGLSIGARPWIQSLNTGYWSWPLPVEAHPEAWATLPRQKLWQRGDVDAVPPA